MCQPFTGNGYVSMQVSNGTKKNIYSKPIMYILLHVYIFSCILWRFSTPNKFIIQLAYPLSVMHPPPYLPLRFVYSYQWGQRRGAITWGLARDGAAFVPLPGLCTGRLPHRRVQHSLALFQLHPQLLNEFLFFVQFCLQFINKPVSLV